MTPFTRTLLPSLFAGAIALAPAHAAVLFETVIHVDGVTTSDLFDPLPTTGMLDADAFGTLSLEVTGAGAHTAIGFFDLEILEPIDTFFNENGTVTGAPAIGQSWEIDEPGFFFGDLLINVENGVLDNGNGVPPGQEDDVAFALGWDFALLADDVATIDWILTDTLPAADFFLTLFDPDNQASVFFYSTLDIATAGGPPGPPPPDPTPVPSPGPLALAAPFLAFGIWSRWGASRRRPARQ